MCIVMVLVLSLRFPDHNPVACVLLTSIFTGNHAELLCTMLAPQIRF